MDLRRRGPWPRQHRSWCAPAGEYTSQPCSVLNVGLESRSLQNPCPCGFYGDTARECRCTTGIIQRYLGKISGPLLDRIDIHVEVPAVAYKELRGNDNGTGSAEIRERVVAARAVQQSRGYYNAHIPARTLRKHCVAAAAMSGAVFGWPVGRRCA